MNDLQKIALEHVQEIVEQLSKDVISLGNILKEEEFDRNKHTYPIDSKLMDIKHWIEAVIENEE